jgi:dihydrofolate reductase
MGRKTYESLGRLLPGRTTVVVTRNKDYKLEGALIAHSLATAVEMCKADEEVFVIGGAELYQDGLKLADKLYITEVDVTVKGDAFLPFLDLSVWQETLRESHASTQGLPFTYITYTRK